MGALSEATQPFYITCLQQQATTHDEAVPLCVYILAAQPPTTTL